MLPREELLEKVLNNSMKIGTHLISHGDHMRIIYFNEEAEYLGDVISLNIVKSPDQISKSILPIFGRGKISSKDDIRSRLLNTFLSKDLSICIVGPSYAGKTSLSILMDSGVPERNNGFTRRSPTLHKATKRIKLGRSRLTIHDMGGQTDFWDGWKEVIPYADKIIFMVDGSANNPQLSAQALDLVLTSRINTCPVLVL